MATCSECKFYKPVDAENGDCFGHSVIASRNADDCPQKAFQPR